MQRIHVTIRPLNREDSVLYFPPEAFGPFRVLHQIGAGTLGPVFRAYEPSRDRLVAVKVFRLDLTPEQTAELVTALQALAARQITHTNIAAPIAAGIEHGTAYLAQEYAVGDSLDVVLRERGPIPMRDVAGLVESLAAAIDRAADAGVSHGLLHMRDIVIGADAARIAGFGIADALEKAGAKLPARPQYSSEQASDVYSLGAIAFEAATGKRASADNLSALESQHGTRVRAAFEMPLAPRQEDRPRRAGDFAKALTAAAGGAAATGITRAPALPTAPAAPLTVTAPIAPVESGAAGPDEAPEPDLDLHIDEPADLTAAPLISTSWTPASSAALSDEIAPEPEARRWPIVAMFVVFAVAAAVSVGFFLRSPRPVPADDRAPGVEATDVDLAASAPDARNAGGKPAPPAPNTPAAPNAPANRVARNRPTPAPTPSRPASGAVRGAQTGSLLIRSTPADADVLVNGKPRGKTPLALRDLALGSYTIHVAREGYAPEERTLQLTARRPTTSATLNLRSAGGNANTTRPGLPAKAPGDAGATAGGINVQSRPSGARVFVNNQLVGSTPIAIPALPSGPATVRIEMDGYQPWTTTVRVGAGEQMRVAASLERQ